MTALPVRNAEVMRRRPKLSGGGLAVGSWQFAAMNDVHCIPIPSFPNSQIPKFSNWPSAYL